MAARNLTSGSGTNDAAAALRGEFDQVLAQIVKTRSMVAAFKLAAEADRHASPELYWPDLMTALNDLLPDEEDASDRFRKLLQQLEDKAADAMRPLASATESRT